MDPSRLSVSTHYSTPPEVPKSGNTKFPGDYIPAIAAAGIVSFLRDEERWSESELKELGRFISSRIC